MRKILLAVMITVGAFSVQAQTSFTQQGLGDTLLTLEGREIMFKDILNAHKGKTIVIDVWASWCKDCVAGMPKAKALQNEYTKDVVYLFLSLDKTTDAWKAGIEKHGIRGQHYFLRSGWKGGFGSSINLDWIPRYMLVNKEGEIVLFKAIEADDAHLLSLLQKLNNKTKAFSGSSPSQSFGSSH